MTPWTFRSYKITFTFEGYYPTTALGVQAWCEDGPFATISTYIEGRTPLLEVGHFFLKDWSENSEIAKAMIADGLIEPVPGVPLASLGHIVTAAYRFTDYGFRYVQQ